MVKNYINGKQVIGEGKEFAVYNPATGEEITKFAGISEEQAEEVLKAAEEAFHIWSDMSVNEREIR